MIILDVIILRPGYTVSLASKLHKDEAVFEAGDSSEK